MMCPNQCTPKEKLLQRINEVSFAVNDILLYLDTHPCCQEALAFYQECAAERRKLMKEYAQCYGPLTVDDALETTCVSCHFVEFRGFGVVLFNKVSHIVEGT